MKLNMSSVTDQDSSQRVKQVISRSTVKLTESEKKSLKQKKKEAAAFFEKGFSHLSDR